MNKIAAVIEEIKSKGEFTIVKLRTFEDSFTSLIVQNSSVLPFVKKNKKVWMVFKESEVSIAKGECKISLQNRFFCKITHIEYDDILAMITLDYKKERVRSLITYNALRELDLKVGDEVFAFVKSNELAIMEL